MNKSPYLKYLIFFSKNSPVNNIWISIKDLKTKSFLRISSKFRYKE